MIPIDSRRQMKNLAEFLAPPLGEWIPDIIPLLENILLSHPLTKEEKETLKMAISYFKLHHI